MERIEVVVKVANEFCPAVLKELDINETFYSIQTITNLFCYYLRVQKMLENTILVNVTNSELGRGPQKKLVSRVVSF